MTNPDLKPGCMALVLSHPAMIGSPEIHPGTVVTLDFYHAQGRVVGGPWDGRKIPTWQCHIAGIPHGSLSWPAASLIPLPPDDEAYKLFSGNIVTVQVTLVNEARDAA